jgi:hypothetical protein
VINCIKPEGQKLVGNGIYANWGDQTGMEDFSDAICFFSLCFTLHLHLLFGLLTIFFLRYDVIFGTALSLHQVAGSFLLERSGLETSYCTGVTQALAVFLLLHYLFLCSYSPKHPRFSLVSFSCNFPRNILDLSIYQLLGLSILITSLRFLFYMIIPFNHLQYR